jgi:hypothetical protein
MPELVLGPAEQPRGPVATDEKVISAITQYLILLLRHEFYPICLRSVKTSVFTSPYAWLQPESFASET